MDIYIVYIYGGFSKLGVPKMVGLPKMIDKLDAHRSSGPAFLSEEFLQQMA